MSAPALQVDGLRVGLTSGDAIVEELDLCVERGEILGLVGESGSGKTTTALALLGYSSPGTKITHGRMTINGDEQPLDDRMRAVRGSAISYVPQDPGRSLNPSLRLRQSLGDVLRAHGVASNPEAHTSMFEMVGLPGATAFSDRYPHQLSGGQQQRVCIAVALACEPPLVVLDEPTTGLDVITQARILSELRRLRQEHGLSMVYVSHDLAVVAEISDRIAVMYAGRIVEIGPADLVLRHPKHPYTRGLIRSIPDHLKPTELEAMPGIAVGVGERPIGCSFAPRCPLRTDACVSEMPALEPVADRHEVRCIHWKQVPNTITATPRSAERPDTAEQKPALAVNGLSAFHRSRHETVQVAEDVSFRIGHGAAVALVGESGSGKTTIARAIAGLHRDYTGEIELDGERLEPWVRRRTVEQRRRMQIIFQNPGDALNPLQTTKQAVMRPAQLLRGLNANDASTRAMHLLERVQLPSRVADLYPAELSGGERQRVSIARALAAEPEVLLCDEITSALDVSVQATVLHLLEELRRELSLTLLFITHDMGVVASISDEVLVLDKGVICERGVTAQVLRSPTSPYAKRLIAAAPSISSTSQRAAERLGA